MDDLMIMAREIDRLSKRIRNIEIQLGGGGVGVLVAKYTTSAGQVINTGAITTVQYDTQVYDVHSLVTTGAGWKFVAPQTGYYPVVGGFGFDTDAAWSANERVYGRIVKNGALYSEGKTVAQTFVIGGYQLGVRYSDIVYLETGDELRIECDQNSGANLTMEADDELNYVSIGLI